MIDLRALLDQARHSGDGEAYALVEKESGHRIGVGVRTAAHADPSCFVEVVLDPRPSRTEVDPKRLEQNGVLATRLRDRGYRLACEDGSSIICERTVEWKTIAEEVRTIRRLLRAESE